MACTRRVSIHARPLGRALPEPAPSCGVELAVSIHARPLGRALRVTCVHNPTKKRFNPRPPFGTGASPGQHAVHDAVFVSIHARPLGRALRTRRIVCVRPAGFQSTPALWDGRFC
ncbi:protein of unknown function [Trichlorobacter ammonificans]|uniref:Uncharacterized protein n=1 Tax=Trichlorobacter ammonificans TaxID=2916410 RepID=A0ABM9D8P1_9BACT|nr:protein of unknown function [Trichlorobacter ammonificans]